MVCSVDSAARDRHERAGQHARAEDRSQRRRQDRDDDDGGGQQSCPRARVPRSIANEHDDQDRREDEVGHRRLREHAGRCQGQRPGSTTRRQVGQGMREEDRLDHMRQRRGRRRCQSDGHGDADPGHARRPGAERVQSAGEPPGRQDAAHDRDRRERARPQPEESVPRLADHERQQSIDVSEVDRRPQAATHQGVDRQLRAAVEEREPVESDVGRQPQQPQGEGFDRQEDRQSVRHRDGPARLARGRAGAASLLG